MLDDVNDCFIDVETDAEDAEDVEIIVDEDHVFEDVIGRVHDAFPPLRPLTTSLHDPSSVSSASLDSCPGQSLKFDNSASVSHSSVSANWAEAPDLFNLSPCPPTGRKRRILLPPPPTMLVMQLSSPQWVRVLPVKHTS